MTTEQDNQRVSGVYRDIATQTTPAALDEKVLELAARAVPSRYGLARAWVRPLAWAATIALSLAFVLEMSQLDDAPTPALLEEIPQQRAEPELPGRSDADLMKAKEEKDLQHGIAAKRSPEAASVPAVADAENLAPLRGAKETVRVPSDEAAVEHVVVSGDRIEADAFADQPAAAAETEAEPVAEELSTTTSRARTSVSHRTALGADTHCDAETRAAAEDWYECIVALREEGLSDAADSELVALREIFPDFAEDRE